MSKYLLVGCILLSLLCFLVGEVEGGRRDICSTGPNKREELKKIHANVQGINATCLVCEVAVTATRLYIDMNNTADKDIAKIIEVFCITLKIEDKNVCVDIVNEFQALFFYLISDRTITADYLCGVIGICPKPVFPGWNVTLTPTPPPTPYPVPNPANPSMYVLHVTDIHVDPLYTPGLTADCGEPICCRPPNPAKEPAAGKWGNYNCDLAPWTYENMLQWIATNLPNISYAVFTGDMPPHDVWIENRTSSLAADTYVLDTFKQYLPKIKLFPAMGNHEAVPVNEFAPRSVGGYWNMSWLYTAISERWANWLPADALTQAEYAGYYTTLTPDGVRIISMNTNLGCNSDDWFLTFPSAESADPDQQLHWLVSTLDSAEKNKEVVYILKHIAPSVDDCGADWYRNYLKIIDRYKNIILGDFAGHTHDDVFTVSYMVNGTTNTSSSVRPVMSTFFAGSCTPYSNENPGFRVLEIDSVTKALIDYTEYYVNLTRANLDGAPTWQMLYKARSAYGLADMSPTSWHKLSLNMGKNQTLLVDYWGRKGKDAYQGTCDQGCLHDTWCELWNPPADAPFSICGL